MSPISMSKSIVTRGATQGRRKLDENGVCEGRNLELGSSTCSLRSEKPVNYAPALLGVELERNTVENMGWRKRSQKL